MLVCFGRRFQISGPGGSLLADRAARVSAWQAVQDEWQSGGGGSSSAAADGAGESRDAAPPSSAARVWPLSRRWYIHGGGCATHSFGWIRIVFGRPLHFVAYVKVSRPFLLLQAYRIQQHICQGFMPTVDYKK